MVSKNHKKYELQKVTTKDIYNILIQSNIETPKGFVRWKNMFKLMIFIGR